jgi:conjugative transfer region protein TrbK
VNRLSNQSWARIAALGLLLLAILVSATTLRERHATASQPAAMPRDPLPAELARCQALGQAGASDARCLAAWSESRRRFLSGGART